MIKVNVIYVYCLLGSRIGGPHGEGWRTRVRTRIRHGMRRPGCGGVHEGGGMHGGGLRLGGGGLHKRGSASERAWGCARMQIPWGEVKRGHAQTRGWQLEGGCAQMRTLWRGNG
jgi:hypothetical protein